MLDTRTIEIVKSTVPLLEAADTALTEHFYKRMFRDNPELKDVFNLSHQANGRQPAALFSAVLAYARNIDQPEVLNTAVERIAHKHTGSISSPISTTSSATTSSKPSGNWRPMPPRRRFWRPGPRPMAPWPASSSAARPSCTGPERRKPGAGGALGASW